MRRLADAAANRLDVGFAIDGAAEGLAYEGVVEGRRQVVVLEGERLELGVANLLAVTLEARGVRKGDNGHVEFAVLVGDERGAVLRNDAVDQLTEGGLVVAPVERVRLEDNLLLRRVLCEHEGAVADQVARFCPGIAVLLDQVLPQR